LERLVATINVKTNKKVKGSEIGEVDSIGMGFGKSHDNFEHQQSLFKYERLLQI